MFSFTSFSWDLVGVSGGVVGGVASAEGYVPTCNASISISLVAVIILLI